MKVNSRVIKSLKENARKTFKKTQLPVFEITENHQIGENFGEKLSNAIEQIFQDNFESVIVVGNDCPDLKVEDILKTKELLQNQELVLGPDLRGGLYLIGIKKDAYDKNDFANFEWQSKNLQNSIVDFAKKRLYNFSKLLQKVDINFNDDLLAFLRTNWTIHFASILKSILQFNLFQFLEIQFSLSCIETNPYLTLRGPPA